MNPYGVYAQVRSWVQTFVFVWRLRIRARLAGADLRLYIRRSPAVDNRDPSNPVTQRFTYRRFEAGIRVRVDRGARLDVYLGDWVRIGSDVRIRLRGGALYLGDWSSIGDGARIDVDGAAILTEGVILSPASAVIARGGDVELQPRSMVGPGTALVAESGSRTQVGAGAVVPGAACVEGPVAAALARRYPRGRLVSVVCSTKDRRAFLPRLFDALERQTLPADRFELVIVDNGSSDGTLEELRERARTTPFRTIVFRREPPGGPARGRNVGWRAARAPIIAFTDDDCAPAPDWLEQAVNAFEGQPGLGLVQGRTLPEPREVGGFGGMASSQLIEWESGHYETCNIFYRRECLEAVDGFREDIPVPAGEDTEVAWRVKALGYDSWFVRTPVVYHAVHPGGIREYPRRFRQWVEVPRVLRRLPAMRRSFYLGYFWTRFHAWFWLAVLGGLLAGLLAVLNVRFWFAALVLCLPYAGFLLRASRETRPLPVRVVAAPLRVAADLIEVSTLVRGSIRFRSLLL